MQWYTGPTWTISIDTTGEEYVFGSEQTARWFQECRTTRRLISGSRPTDNGNFFMTDAERDEVLAREPGLAKFIRQVYGAKEFIQNIKRYCFWLVDATPADIKRSKILYERVSRVKEFRLASTDKKTRKDAEIPSLFQEIRQPKTDYLLIPCHSSKERMYIPIGYVPADVIITNAVFSLQHATLYHFGILTSSVHMGWTRRVCGRLRNDYRYSIKIVYNNFIWPLADPWQVKRICSTAQRILDVRAKYPSSSYADLYDEVSMPKDLRDAHRANDDAVLEAYGLPKNMEEAKIVDHMFRLMCQAAGEEYPES